MESEELKSLLMKVKEESEKAELKLNIQKTKIMPSSPITLWQIDGEKVETVTDLVFLGFKITADSDCSQEIKISLLLGRKAVTKLDSVLKNRNITLLTKSRIVKAMVFPVVMYRYKRWIIRKSVKVIVVQSCPTLFDPVDCSPPGSSVHGILEARILEWLSISFSRRSSQPRD